MRNFDCSVAKKNCEDKVAEMFTRVEKSINELSVEEQATFKKLMDDIKYYKELESRDAKRYNDSLDRSM